jgi:hypothetical protein
MKRTIGTGLCVSVLAAGAFGAGSRLAAQTASCAAGERPLDGSCNASGDRGTAGSPFIRIDGSETAPSARPAARDLSNLFLAQEPFPGLDPFETTRIPFDALKTGQHPQSAGLNAFAVAFGQAVVHDLTKARVGFAPSALSAPDYQYTSTDPLCQKIAEVSATALYYFPCTAATTVNGDGTTTVGVADASRYTLVSGSTWTYFNGPFAITVPTARYTNRKSTFPLAASLADDDSGATRVPINDVTSFLDLSIIYGNSAALNAKLRASDGSGRLLTAPDGDIPFGGPGVPNDCGAFDPVTNPQSASGDSRVDENLFLDAIHSLYFRNHNRDAAWVAAHRPDLTTDEQRFQRARAINIARFQQQVYNELLPAVFGQGPVSRYVGHYRGYDAAVDPRIASTFDLAFRVAHSQVSLPPYVVDGLGAPVIIEGTLGFPQHSRPNCLFTTFRTVGGAAIARSAIAGSAQAVTGGVSDLMRNIVFRSANGQSTAGFNLDIEQLNIIRGREFGTPNFNVLRKFWRGRGVYELPGCSRAAEADVDALQCFAYVTTRSDVAQRLQTTYRHVDRIDAFIGLILEHTADSDDADADQEPRFPPTATAIILDQFRRTRAGDRFFYLNADAGLNFSAEESRRINETVAESLEASYGLPVIRDAFHVPVRQR